MTITTGFENKVNIEQVLNYLQHSFSRAATKAAPKIGSKAIRFVNEHNKIETTRLYDYQIEFCYLVNEIQRGPTYIIPKIIQDTNDLISKLDRET